MVPVPMLYPKNRHLPLSTMMVHKEIQSGRIINLPLSNLHLSPVGLVPKSDGGGE